MFKSILILMVMVTAVSCKKQSDANKSVTAPPPTEIKPNISAINEIPAFQSDFQGSTDVTPFVPFVANKDELIGNSTLATSNINPNTVIKKRLV